MVRSLLIRGMLVGFVAGLLVFGFGRVFGEPSVNSAISFETALDEAKAKAHASMGMPASMLAPLLPATLAPPEAPALLAPLLPAAALPPALFAAAPLPEVLVAPAVSPTPADAAGVSL